MSAPISKLTFTCALSCQKINLIRNITYRKFDFIKRNFSSQDLKKFYKVASISQVDSSWFEINLDKRKLKTPGGKIFQVPNEALALAVATEWNMQEKTIKRHNMHLTALCNTAIENPMHKSRDDTIKSILHFLETDTVCYMVSEPEDLAIYQQREWQPIIDWASHRYGIHIESTTGLSKPDVPQRTVEILQHHLMSYNDWALPGYQYAVDIVKSLIIILALVDRHITVEHAVLLSRLEQEYQVQQWGNVEWYHDIDQLDLKARLSAATLFIHWCSENTSIKQKAKINQII